MTASHEKAAASTTPSAFRRQPCLRRTGYALLATAVLLPLGAVSATAALQPVDSQFGITLFPQRDFLGVEGFPQAPLTINVVRDGVIVGTAHGTPLPDAETGTLLEVNHPGGVCWTGVTPDLLPGDRVEVVTEDDPNPANQVGAFSNLMNVKAEPAQLLDLNGVGGRDDLVIRGTAAAADGTKLAEGLMEQRIVAPDLKETSVGRRDIRALFTGGIADGVATTGDIAWDNPTNPFDTSWTATYTDLGADIAAIAAAGQTRVLAWERTDVLDNRIGMTIYEADEIGGPGFGGCPPLASDGVTGTAPANVNIAARSAANLVINGVSTDATSVDLVVDDQDADLTDQVKVSAIPTNAASTDPAVALPGAQTWRASVAMADVLAAGLAEGELTVSGTFHRMVETTTQQDTDADPATPPVDVKSRATRPLNGASHTLLKDLVAPVAPTASPAGGQYIGTQSVTLSPDDEIEDTVRYRIGTSTVGDPTSASPAATGQIAVSTSQTIKSRSFDRAGNPSTVVTSAYDIRTDIVPSAPAAPRVAAADAAIDVTWTAPTGNGGSAITGYVLRAHQAGTIVAEVSATGNSGRIPGLVNGTDYTVTVTAVNASGEGAPSASSATVSPRPPVRTPFSPTIGTATAVSSGANVTWTPPSSNGGSAITSYTVALYNSGTGTQVSTRSVAATATSAQFTGLSNGTSYEFDVRAVNAIGAGDPSDRSNSVVPAGLAGAPTGQTAAAGNASAVVNWVAPANTGGAEINSYQVQVRTGTTVLRTEEFFDTEAVITRLTNGTAYNFRIRAVTSAGLGALSGATTAVTPTAPTPPANPAPTVTATSPAAGATGVVGTANVTATFSEAVNGADTRFTLTAPNGSAVAAAVTLNTARTVATLNPTATLAASTTYTARLVAGITDNGGAALAPRSWTFTTAAATNAAPQLSGRTPAVNATGVAVGVSPTATFNEAVTGVSTTTFQLRNQATGALITATVTPHATVANRWVLNPNANLARNTLYTVTVTGGAAAIRDAQGAPLTTTSWTFRTVV